MDWLRRLGQNRLVDFGVAVIGIMAVIRIVLVLPARVGADDFGHYYIAGRVLLEGGDPYAPALAPLYARYGFTSAMDVATLIAPYPPPFVFLMTPFAVLEPRPAYWCWVTLEVAALVTVLGLTCWLLRDRLSRRGRWLMIALVIASAPVYWHFFYAQLGMLLAALVLAGYTWHRHGHPILGCLAVTMAGLLKLFPFVLVPWFVWRGPGGWRGRAARGAVVVIFGAVVMGVTGVERWQAFWRNSVAVVAEQSLNHTFNYTVPGLLINLRLAFDGFASPAEVVRAWMTFGTAVGLVLIGGGYIACLWRGDNRELEFCLLSVVMLAGSVLAWGHYFVFLIFPATVIAVRINERPTVRRVVWFGVALVASNVMATLTAPFLDRYLVVKVLGNNLPLGGLVWLGGLLSIELWRRERA